MIWILLSTIVLLLIFFLIVRGRKLDFSEPTFLLLASMLLSILFVILNYEQWNVESELTFLTVIVIIVSIIFFIIGNFISKAIYASIPKKRLLLNTGYTKVLVNNLTCFMAVIFISFSAIYYLMQLRRSSGIGIGNFISFMTAIRPLLKENLISIGFIATQLFSISKAIAYIFTYIFMWNLIKAKIVQLKLLIIPLMYLLMSLLTSGRIYLIYYLIYAFSLYFLLSVRNRGYSVRTILKVIIRLFGGIFLVLIIFGLLANIVGRNTQHTIFEQISVYVGGPLISFAEFINYYDYHNRPAVFGEETLVGIYHLLNTLGVTTYQANRHLEFTQFGNNWGNIYTALRRYIYDYGIAVNMGIMTFIGLFYGFLHEVAVNEDKLSLKHIIYCMLLFPIPMMIIDETFMSTIISLNTVYDIFYIIIIYKVITTAYRKKVG